MSEVQKSIERLDDFLENLAEEVEPYLLDTQKFLYTLNDRELPMSTYAVATMFPKIESLRIGIFAVAEKEEYYSLNVLYRSAIEHFLKANYLWMRMITDKTDQIGIDYWVFGNKKESIDYVKNLTKAFELIGLKSEKTPLEILKEMGIVSESASASEIQRRQSQFGYKFMASYLSESTNAETEFHIDLLTRLLPEYSRLSSSVHGGPFSVSAYEEDHKRLIDAIEFSVFSSLFIRYIFYLMAFQKDEKFGELLKISEKYLTYFSHSAQLLVASDYERE